MKKKNRKSQDRPKPDVKEEEASPNSESGSFGPWLRRQREVREIELREIADASKIGVAYLAALEENRFEILPADVFVRGFLRQYALFVGLDPEEVVNYYLAARQAEKDQEDDAAEELRPPRRASGRKYVLVILLLAGVLVAAVWWLSKLREKEADALASSAGSPAAAPTVAAPQVPTPAAQRDTVAPGTSSNGSPATGQETQLAAPDTALDRASDTATDAEPDSLATAPASAPGADTESPLRVVLDFTGDCWVEASVDGARRLAEMRVQGESVQLDAERDIALKVGDFSKVRVEVNGQPYELVGPSGSGSVRNVVIDLALAESLTSGIGELTP